MTRNTNEFGQQEYSRILSAAVVNARFCQALLKNPAQAIASGYWGEKFHLGNEERQRVASIQAKSLADFATQLSQAMDFSRMPVAAVGD